MPGSLSSSSREAVLMLMRSGVWFDEKLFSGVEANETAVCPFILTQDEADSRAHSVIGSNAHACLPRNLCVIHAKRCRRTGWRMCRANVQNARSLNFSGTCNNQRPVFHRLFHSSCGNLIRALTMISCSFHRLVTFHISIACEAVSCQWSVVS